MYNSTQKGHLGFQQSGPPPPFHPSFFPAGTSSTGYCIQVLVLYILHVRYMYNITFIRIHVQYYSTHTQHRYHTRIHHYCLHLLLPYLHHTTTQIRLQFRCLAPKNGSNFASESTFCTVEIIHSKTLKSLLLLTTSNNGISGARLFFIRCIKSTFMRNNANLSKFSLFRRVRSVVMI